MAFRKECKLPRTALEGPFHVEPFLFYSHFLLFLSEYCDRWFCPLSPIHPMSLHMLLLLLGTSLSVCLAISDSSLGPNSKSLTLWHFPDTSLPWGRAQYYLYQSYLHLCTSTFAFTILYYDALFIVLSSYLTRNTVEGLHHIYSLFDFQHLAECLIPSKHMQNYK